MFEDVSGWNDRPSGDILMDCGERGGEGRGECGVSKMDGGGVIYLRRKTRGITCKVRGMTFRAAG